jgi:hypothetical protein
MSWHFLQGQVEASWAESSLAGAPSALLSMLPTQEASCLPVNEMESLNDSQFGMMSELSMESLGAERLTSSLAVSHAKTLAPMAAQTEKDLMEKKAAFGVKWQESFVRYDRDSHLWKTRQHSLFGGLEEYSEVWPQWGMMLSGECFLLPMLAHDTDVRGFGLRLGTPTAEMTVRGQAFRNGCPTLREFLHGSTPNPPWVEWLMGWPIAWTELKPLEMAKFQQWFGSHGNY